MGYKPIFIQNENLAPKLAKKVLRLISGLFLLVGKPIFLLFLLILTITLNLFNITGYIFEGTYRIIKEIYTLKNNLGLRKKKGLIFSASRERLKQKTRHLQGLFENTRKKGNKELLIFAEKIKAFLWFIEVLPIALEKLAFRFITYLRKNFQPIKTLRLLILRFSLFLLALKKNVLKIGFPKLPKFSFFKILSGLLILVFIIGFIGGVGFWYFILKDLPSPQELNSREQKVSTKIYDRNGILLYNIYKDQNRTPVQLEDIPAQIKLATIAIEDAEFYTHPGFSIKGIARALIKNYREKRLTGGSTITQQLVKNTLLSSEKTYVRKIKELALAIQVEMTFSKDEILEMYLNEVAYGGTAYGIQEASRMYFGKDVEKLSLAEAALLAGLPKSPTEFSPFGSKPELSLLRQKEVLNLMEINGFITPEQRKSAESEIIKFSDQRTDIKAPHFVMYVRQILEEKYGKNTIDSGGLDIKTTLDLSIQNLAEKIVKEEIEKLTKLNVTNAAVIVLNPKSGEVLAMVGSKDYFDSDNDGNVNVTIQPRQPGSSIKVVNYAYALSNGMNLTTIIPDTPVTFLVEGQPPYTPKNYEGNYRGKVTLRNALAESRNIPAVRVLASYGVDKMTELGKKMGITTWENPNNYGLSLTLGGGEVKLLDLAQVYATIANYGKRPDTNLILKISNHQGDLIEKFEYPDQENDILTVKASASESTIANKINSKSDNESQIIDSRVAFLITDVLKDNYARSPTFGSNSLLVIPNHPEVAVKTGTSNSLHDNLTVGYNQDFLVAVWVGNNDNSPMERIASGITGATPIWNKIMSALLAKEESREWTVPEKLVKTSVCPLTGTLACLGCPNKNEWFLQENIPKYACNPDWFLAKIDENSDQQNAGSENTVSQEQSEKEKIETKPEIIDLDKEKRKKNTLGNVTSY